MVLTVRRETGNIEPWDVNWPIATIVCKKSTQKVLIQSQRKEINH